MRIILFVIFLLVGRASVEAQLNIQSVSQGFDMRIRIDNLGQWGRNAFLGGSPPYETGLIGFEYPVGSHVEHLYGGGVWVGGKLDTARIGTSPQLRLVSTAYEGWSGPLNEFFPGSSPADTIWKVNFRGVPRPPSWESYWGNLIPRVSVSDNDMYMIYTDYQRTVTSHIPLRLKVAQSSFVWSDPDAEGIHIVEYKIMNAGIKTIDSAYIGFFSEMDVGFISQTNFFQTNYSGFLATSKTGFAQHPFLYGITPAGLTILRTPRPLDSLRFSFRWFPGPQTPTPDVNRYAMLSSGVINPDEYPLTSDTRFVLSCGPFTIRPVTHATPDTLVVAFAFVAGQTVNQLNDRALRARQLYSVSLESSRPRSR